MFSQSQNDKSSHSSKASKMLMEDKSCRNLCGPNWRGRGCRCCGGWASKIGAWPRWRQRGESSVWKSFQKKNLWSLPRVGRTGLKDQEITQTFLQLFPTISWCPKEFGVFNVAWKHTWCCRLDTNLRRRKPLKTTKCSPNIGPNIPGRSSKTYPWLFWL